MVKTTVKTKKVKNWEEQLTRKTAGVKAMLKSPAHEQIARKAYEIYERKGSSHGHDLNDWLEAEKGLKGAR